MHYPLSSSRWAAVNEACQRACAGRAGARREACGPLVGPEEGQLLWELSKDSRDDPPIPHLDALTETLAAGRDGGPKFRSTGLNWKGVSIGKRAFADVTKSLQTPQAVPKRRMTILKETESVRPGEKGRLHRAAASLEPAGWGGGGPSGDVGPSRCSR